MENVIINGSNIIINGFIIAIAWLLKHCGFTKKGNVKLGGEKARVWTWSTLKGNEPIFVKVWNAFIVGTCGKHCVGCSKACYVNASYRYGSVIYGHAKNTIAIRYLLPQLYERLRNQILKAKKKPDLIRINQSGELQNKAELKMFCDLAREFPEIQFWLYTKNYEVITPALLNDEVPKNLTILISVWHENGIQTYQLLKEFDNVKAFVYDDKTFNYETAGIGINTYCKAYDENGKLDHNVTCDICKKCFNRNSSHKCIGCNAH